MADQIVATPSASSYYFTKGKRYPARPNSNGRLFTVVCDYGHERFILPTMDKSAHLLFSGELPPAIKSDIRAGRDIDGKADNYRWAQAGHWTFERVTTSKIHIIESADQLDALLSIYTSDNWIVLNPEDTRLVWSVGVKGFGQGAWTRDIKRAKQYKRQHNAQKRADSLNTNGDTHLATVRHWLNWLA